MYSLEILQTTLAIDDDTPLDTTPEWSKHELVGDAENRFFRLYGDFDGNGIVNEDDRETIDYWFGQGIPRAPGYASLPGLGECLGVLVFTIGFFENDALGNQVVFPGGIPADVEPPTVVSIEINSNESWVRDGERTGSGPLPSTWQEQRSYIRTIDIEFSEIVTGMSVDSVSLKRLGATPPNEPDLPDTEIPLSEIRGSGSSYTLLFEDDPLHYSANEELPDGVFSLQIVPLVIGSAKKFPLRRNMWTSVQMAESAFSISLALPATLAII